MILPRHRTDPIQGLDVLLEEGRISASKLDFEVGVVCLKIVDEVRDLDKQ